MTNKAMYIVSCFVSYLLLNKAFRNNRLDSRYKKFNLYEIDIFDILLIFIPLLNIIYAIKTYIMLSVNVHKLQKIYSKFFR